jgi:hypothetical protein
MASKSTELKNLSSRDKATRRKAVRWLFENEINDSLPYFIPFLSDEDIWFRERAKSAFTRWCSDVDIELIEQLLSKDLLEHEYFVSTLLFNFSNEGERIIRKLLNSENYLVRCNVRTFQLSKTEKNNLSAMILETLEDPDYRVRSIGASFVNDSELNDPVMEKLFSDNHSKVKLSALKNINLNPKRHKEWIDLFLESNDGKIRLLATISQLDELLKKSNYVFLVDVFSKATISEKREFVSEMINLEWNILTDLINYLYEHKYWEFLIFLSNKSSSDKAIELRYKLAKNTHVPIDYRIKIIEKLKSRANRMDFSELIENLEESSDERLIQAGEQLRGLLI